MGVMGSLLDCLPVLPVLQGGALALGTFGAPLIVPSWSACSLALMLLCVSFQSLLSIRQDDKVVCPRTKEVFHFSQAEKVYIM